MTLYYMHEALRQAEQAVNAGESPIGAVVVHAPTGQILARGHNLVIAHSDPTAHAEIVALREACALSGAPRIPECDLYVTLEPCPMCAQAIAFARIRRLYFGAYDPKGGGVEHGARVFSASSCHHRPEVVGGLEERKSAALLKGFFEALR